MEEGGFDVQGCHLGVRDIDAVVVGIGIELTGDGEAGGGASVPFTVPAVSCSTACRLDNHGR